MKDLDKMTKDELKELIKKLEGEGKDAEKEEKGNMKDLLKDLFKEYKSKRLEDNERFEEQKEKVKETFDELLEDSFCVLVATNNGLIQVGSKTDIMSLISCSITELLEKGQMNENDLDVMFNAIKRVTKVDKAKKDTKNELEELLNQLDEIFN